jgi:hypothetical protein
LFEGGIKTGYNSNCKRICKMLKNLVGKRQRVDFWAKMKIIRCYFTILLLVPSCMDLTCSLRTSRILDSLVICHIGCLNIFGRAFIYMCIDLLSLLNIYGVRVHLFKLFKFLDLLELVC